MYLRLNSTCYLLLTSLPLNRAEKPVMCQNKKLSGLGIKRRSHGLIKWRTFSYIHCSKSQNPTLQTRTKTLICFPGRIF